jgi:hypothetical protein
MRTKVCFPFLRCYACPFISFVIPLLFLFVSHNFSFSVSCFCLLGAKGHISVGHFLKVYYLQPWISQHAIDDIRYEERISGKEVKLGRLTEELSGIVYKIQENQNKKRILVQQVKNSEDQIMMLKDPPAGGVEESTFAKEKREKSLQQAYEVRKKAFFLFSNLSFFVLSLCLLVSCCYLFFRLCFRLSVSSARLMIP